jgi:amino acid transporter
VTTSVTMSASGDRPIGFGSLLALGVNGIVGVGIFFAPALVAAQVPGEKGVLVYVATALTLLPIAAGYAALGSRFSVDGGPYVWARAAFGPRVAFLVGWLTFVSSLFSVAAVVSGLADHAAPLFGITSTGATKAFAVFCVLTFASIAATGLRPSALVWSAVAVLKLLPLVTLVAFGLSGLSVNAAPAATGQETGAETLARAILVVVFAFQGFEIVPLLAGSVRRSERAVPIATVASLAFASVLYVVLHALCVRAVPDLATSHAPLVHAARVYGGSTIAGVVAAGANVSAMGIAFGMLNTTPRYLSALSGDGAFGPWIGTTDGRFVPQRALWLTVTAVVTMVALSGRLTQLFVLSSLAVLAQYGVTLASLGALAWRRQHGLSRHHLWPVPLSMAGILVAALGAKRMEMAVAAIVVLAGEGLRRGFGERRIG